MAANDRLLDEWKLRGNSEPLLPIPWSAAGMRNGNNLKIVSSLLAIDHDKREPPQQISSGFELAMGLRPTHWDENWSSQCAYDQIQRGRQRSFALWMK